MLTIRGCSSPLAKYSAVKAETGAPPETGVGDGVVRIE